MPSRKRRKKRQLEDSRDVQIRVLADRLALVLSKLEDLELEAFCDGTKEELAFWQWLNEEIEALALGSNSEAMNRSRELVRKLGGYNHTKERISKMLKSGLKENYQKSKRSAA